MRTTKTIYFIAFFSGFLSLSQEILWMRIISFSGHTVPQAFAYALALFLFGIALGANIGKNLCAKNKSSIPMLGNLFWVAGFVDLILLSLTIALAQQTYLIWYLGLFIFICASVRGIVFPMVHHVGTNQIKNGKQISNVYFANVLGSTIAPILISFVLLDILSTQQVYIFICALTFTVSLICSEKLILKGITALIVMGCVLSLISIPEQIFYQMSYKEDLPNVEIIENKHGFIQIYHDKANQDKIVYGANVYDGKLNTNIFTNTNGINRAYLLPVIQPQAENILVIGLSTGSWVKVLSTMPNLKKITVVEINPAYTQLIQSDPIVSDILKDPRIDIIFDDGRKWMKKNEDNQFDIILMNTTWHWRAYTTNLLSQDFLKLAQLNLKPNGFIFYNTTASANAFHTAPTVFPYVYKYQQMLLASQQPVQLPSQEQMANTLCQLKNHANQQMLFKNSAECHLAANIILEPPFKAYNALSEKDFTSTSTEIITDDNMINEYKFGLGLGL